MTTDERLETLEKGLARAKRRNRRLLVVVGLVAGVFALVWIAAAAANRAEAQAGGVPTVIRAGQFELVDASGKLRASLSVDKDGVGLALLDENGKPRAGLTMIKDGPGLALLDGNGMPRAALSVGKDGPGLRLYDENGKPRAGLGTGQTVLPDGRKTIYPESSLRLFGPDGKVNWQAP